GGIGGFRGDDARRHACRAPGGIRDLRSGGGRRAQEVRDRARRGAADRGRAPCIATAAADTRRADPRVRSTARHRRAPVVAPPDGGSRRRRGRGYTMKRRTPTAVSRLDAVLDRLHGVVDRPWTFLLLFAAGMVAFWWLRVPQVPGFVAVNSASPAQWVHLILSPDLHDVGGDAGV